MRLVAASLAVISLLTACAGGDIVAKTDLDESYIVKDSAVSELESPFEKKISSYNRSIKDVQDFYDEMAGKAKKCVSRKFLSQVKCDEIYLSPNSELDELARQAESNIKVIKEAMMSEDPLIKQVRYRPIFVDLNNEKRAMGYVTLTCISPSLDSKKAADLVVALEESIDDVDLSKAYYSAGLKVCRKYAYKDAYLFAYREAKESDETKESD